MKNKKRQRTVAERIIIRDATSTAVTQSFAASVEQQIASMLKAFLKLMHYKASRSAGAERIIIRDAPSTTATQ